MQAERGEKKIVTLSTIPSQIKNRRSPISGPTVSKAQTRAKRSLLERIVTRLYPRFSMELGEGVVIEKNVTITGHSRIRLRDGVRIYEGCKLVVDIVDSSSGLEIGRDVAMNFNCFVDGSGGVKIAHGVLLGPGVCILSSAHRINDLPIQKSGKDFAPVFIGADAWIGANAVIMPGVKIGAGAVIGAGSVVTKDVPTKQVWAGAPAKFLRERA